MSKGPDFSEYLVFVDESGDHHLVHDCQNSLRQPFPF